MPEMPLSAFVKFLKSWMEDPRVADYSGDNPLESLSIRMMKRDVENALDCADTILHLGDDDIYIAERADKQKELADKADDDDTKDVPACDAS